MTVSISVSLMVRVAALSAFARLRQSRSRSGTPTPQTAPSNVQGLTHDMVNTEVQSSLPTRRSKRATSSNAEVSRPVTPAAEANLQSTGSVPPDEPSQSHQEQTTLDSHVQFTQIPSTQFSNFRPNKSNFKKKAGGGLQLKLVQGEVGRPNRSTIIR